MHYFLQKQFNENKSQLNKKKQKKTTTAILQYRIVTKW